MVLFFSFFWKNTRCNFNQIQRKFYRSLFLALFLIYFQKAFAVVQIELAFAILR